MSVSESVSESVPLDAASSIPIRDASWLQLISHCHSPPLDTVTVWAWALAWALCHSNFSSSFIHFDCTLALPSTLQHHLNLLFSPLVHHHFNAPTSHFHPTPSFFYLRSYAPTPHFSSLILATHPNTRSSPSVFGYCACRARLVHTSV